VKRVGLTGKYLTLRPRHVPDSPSMANLLGARMDAADYAVGPMTRHAPHFSGVLSRILWATLTGVKDALTRAADNGRARRARAKSSDPQEEAVPSTAATIFGTHDGLALRHENPESWRLAQSLLGSLKARAQDHLTQLARNHRFGKFSHPFIPVPPATQALLWALSIPSPQARMRTLQFGRPFFSSKNIPGVAGCRAMVPRDNGDGKSPKTSHLSKKRPGLMFISPLAFTFCGFCSLNRARPVL